MNAHDEQRRRGLRGRPWRSLRLRLSAYVVGIVLLSASVGLGFDYARERDLYLEEVTTALQENAAALRLAQQGMQDQQKFRQYVEKFCAQASADISAGYHVLVLDRRGDVVARAEQRSNAEVGSALLAADPDEEVLQVGDCQVAQFRLAARDGTTIIVAQYLDNMGSILRDQLVSRSLRAGATALVTVGLIFLGMNGWLLRPLFRLKAAAKAWAGRDFSARSEVTGPDELRVLANEFNAMAGELERHEATRQHAEEERLRFEARLQEAQKMESLAVLAGGIAHDFNNLLTGVLGNAELALAELPPPSPVREYCGDIRRSALLAADLSKQMLAYSGRGRFLVEPLNLNDVVEGMAELATASVSKKAAVKWELASALPPIEADATQIRQVLMNLVTNASEALCDKAGTIAIRTGVMDASRQYLSQTQLGENLPEGPYVYLEVSDTGCGMTEATKAKVFEPFFTTKFAGRGLGLSAVLGIVRGHRGAIRVDSEPAKGATFRILFPPGARTAPGAAPTRGTQRPLESRGAGTILVVDDEYMVRTVARKMLERSGFTVLAAADGEEGIREFREHAQEVAAVLLDLTMPRMSGDEVLAQMRAIRPDVPVLLCSGYNEQDATGRFAGKGLAGFVQKPFDHETLVRRIRSVVESGPSAKEPPAKAGP